MAFSTRRAIVLGLKLGLGLALLAGASAFWYLNSARFREMARARIVSAIEARFPVRAELDSVSIGWWGPRLKLQGLRIRNGRFEEELPAVEIDQIEVDLTVNRLWRPSASLDALRLQSPRIRIVRNSNDRFNLWNMFRNQDDLPPKLTALIRLAIDDLDIRDGLIRFQDRSFYLESSRGGMAIEMEFVPAAQSYRGLLRLSGLDLDTGPFALRRLDSTIRFGLFENSIELEAVDLSSPQVSGTASGVIDDLGELVYRFNVNLRLVPTLFERPDFGEFFEEGEPLAVGAFAGRKGSWSFEGQVSSARARVKGLLFEGVEAKIRADSRSVAVDRIAARFQGGSLRASGELSWDEADPSSFEVSGEGLRVERLLAPLRLAPFRPRGSASARGRFQWRGLDWSSLGGSGRANYRGEFGFAGSTAPQTPIRTFPFAGGADFLIDRGGAAFSDGVVDLLGGQLRLDGSIGFEGSYDVRLDFQAPVGGPSLDAAVEAGALPREAFETWRPGVNGPTRLNGRFQGLGGDFRLAGNLSADAVELGGGELGAIRGGFELTPDAFTVESLQLDGGVGFQASGAMTYRFAGADRPPGWERLSLAGRGDARRWISTAGLDWPVGGQVSGRIEIEEDASGEVGWLGDFSWERPAWQGVVADSVGAELEWTGDRILLNRLNAVIGSGRVEGALVYEIGSRRLEGDLRGSRIPLAPFQALSEALQRIQLQGEVDFSLTTFGTLDQPGFRWMATSDLVEAGGLDLGRVRLSAAREPEAGRDVPFQVVADVLGDRLSATGQLGMDAPYPLQASLRLDRFPLNPALKLLPIQTDIELGGEASGSLEILGPLEDPAALEATGVLSALNLTMAGYQVRNEGNVTVVYRSGSVSLLPLTLVGPQTELNLSGSVGLTDDRPLNLKADGKVNLLSLNSFLTGGATFGQVTLETVLTGTFDQPRIVGQASLEKGFLRHPAVPATFFDASGSFRFTADQIGIDEFSARTPFGVINAEGGVFLEGLTPVRWLVNVFGTGLRLEYPEKVQSVLDVDLDWINNQDSQLVSGVVYVRSAEYQEQITIPDLILRYGSGSDLLNPTAAPAVDVALDLEVEGYRTLEIDNNLARVTASGDFKIRGTLQNPVILGSLTVDEGTLFLENNEYDVTRGTITFNDPRATRPVFDFEAETEVRDFQVSVLLRGPLDQFNVSFRSDPPLANSSIVSLLAVGQTEEEIFGVEGRGQDQVGSLAIYGAGALLSKSLGKKLEAETSRLFGFDKLSIDPFLYGNERDPGARVTLGKRLSKNLSVTYSTDLSNEGQGQIVVVELKLTDWLTVVGTGEQTGAVAVDFKLRKRF